MAGLGDELPFHRDALYHLAGPLRLTVMGKLGSDSMHRFSFLPFFSYPVFSFSSLHSLHSLHSLISLGFHNYLRLTPLTINTDPLLSVLYPINFWLISVFVH